MYTKRIYSPKRVMMWTRYETVVFFLIALVPVLLYDVFGQRWLHLPWLPIALIGTAVAFMLGFQNSATYGRLWEARKIWGGIVNTSRAWGLMVNDFITDDFAEEKAGGDELQAIRRTLIMRHIGWLTALRHALRQPRPWESFRLSRTNREVGRRFEVREHQVSLEDELSSYVTAEEWAHLVSVANRPTQILAKQSQALRRLKTRGLIDDFRHMEMERILVELLAGQGKAERIKNFPYPRQYATLHALFVWIFIVLLPFGLAGEFDAVGAKIAGEYPAVGRWFLWLCIPFSVVVMWVFHTIERIGRVSENPFEGSANDVPITTMARGVEIDLREMLGEDPETIPPPIEAKYDVQT